MAGAPTGRYHGPAELLLDGDKVADVVIDLRGSARVLNDGTLAGPGESAMGTQRWDGRIVSATGHNLRDLYMEVLQKSFTLRTPDGRETTAFLRNDRGTLAGSTPFPF